MRVEAEIFNAVVCEKQVCYVPWQLLSPDVYNGIFNRRRGLMSSASHETFC
jgi:hypothetical protein